jgi:hypothetical protein
MLALSLQRAAAMDPRFPALKSQSQLDAQVRALRLPDAPSLPYGEWLVGLAVLALLLLA